MPNSNDNTDPPIMKGDTLDNSKSKRKRLPADPQNIGSEKDADTAAPTKSLRNEGQKSARSAPSTLTLKTQLETTATAFPRDSPQLPPSPSPATKKDGPMLLADSPSQQLSTPTTPTDIFRPNAQQPPAPGMENGNIDQMDMEQPAQVSIRDRMAAANEHGDTESTNRTSAWNPLDKYTNSDMDPVHLGHPMAALKNIDLDTIGSWEQIPGVKLLAQPFGAYTNKIENHNALKALIFAALIEITNADKVSICAPRHSPTTNRNPFSFLIHNLSEK